MTTKKRTPEEEREIKARLRDEHLLETFPDLDDSAPQPDGSIGYLVLPKRPRQPECPHCQKPGSVPTFVVKPADGSQGKLVCGACQSRLVAEGWTWVGIGDAAPIWEP